LLLRFMGRQGVGMETAGPETRQSHSSSTQPHGRSRTGEHHGTTPHPQNRSRRGRAVNPTQPQRIRSTVNATVLADRRPPHDRNGMQQAGRTPATIAARCGHPFDAATMAATAW
jgi:hypothetical protein